MDHIEILIAKIDDMLTVNRDALDASREMLAELRRMSDVTALQIEHQNKEIERLEKEIDNNKDARRSIYQRLEKLEARCMANHKGIVGRQGLISENFDGEVTKWAHGPAGRVLLWGASSVIAVILTRLAGRIL